MVAAEATAGKPSVTVLGPCASGGESRTFSVFGSRRRQHDIGECAVHVRGRRERGFRRSHVTGLRTTGRQTAVGWSEGRAALARARGEYMHRMFGLLRVTVVRGVLRNGFGRSVSAAVVASRPGRCYRATGGGPPSVFAAEPVDPAGGPVGRSVVSYLVADAPDAYGRCARSTKPGPRGRP